MRDYEDKISKTHEKKYAREVGKLKQVANSSISQFRQIFEEEAKLFKIELTDKSNELNYIKAESETTLMSEKMMAFRKGYN